MLTVGIFVLVIQELDPVLKDRLKRRDGLFQLFFCTDCRPHEPFDQCHFVEEDQLEFSTLMHRSAVVARTNELVGRTYPRIIDGFRSKI